MKDRRRTEGAEAPRRQGATTENTGQYLRKKQRSRRGCIGGRMQPAFHHGLLGGFVLYAVFQPAMRIPAIALGAVSLASIVALAWSTGGYNEPLARVILADISRACRPIARARHWFGQAQAS